MDKTLYARAAALLGDDEVHRVHLRFELGAPHRNGSQARIRQVVQRVHSLFEAVFASEERLFVVVKDYGGEGKTMWGDVTPDYLYELMGERDCLRKFQPEQGENPSFWLRVYSDICAELPYKQILTGIAYLEQGRRPCIAESVFFVHLARRIIFHMYDDRGCIIYADAAEKLRPLYEERGEWLVDYWREHIDSFFKT